MENEEETTVEEDINKFRESIDTIAFRSGWSLDYVIELDILTLANIINPPENKETSNPKRTKSQDKKRLEQAKKDFMEFDRRAQKAYNKIQMENKRKTDDI